MIRKKDRKSFQGYVSETQKTRNAKVLENHRK